jgi:putative ABC transport system permease protein
VRATLDAPVPTDRLERIALDVPGVVRAEAWGLRNANRVRADGSESGDFTIMTPPAGSDFIRPTIAEGRWLLPGDRNTIVVDPYMLRQEPDLKVGDELTLKIDGRETTWQIVGFARKVIGEVDCYVNYDAFAEALGEPGQASLLHVVTDRHDSASQAEAESALKARLKEQGVSVSSTLTTPSFARWRRRASGSSSYSSSSWPHC